MARGTLVVALSTAPGLALGSLALAALAQVPGWMEAPSAHPATLALAELEAALAQIDPGALPAHLFLETGRGCVVLVCASVLAIVGSTVAAVLNAEATNRPGMLRATLVYIAALVLLVGLLWPARQATRQVVRVVAEMAMRTSGRLDYCVRAVLTAPATFVLGGLSLCLLVGGLLLDAHKRVALVLAVVVLLGRAAVGFVVSWNHYEQEKLRAWREAVRAAQAAAGVARPHPHAE